MMNFRPCLFGVASVALLSLGVATPTAHAQWTVTNLHPVGVAESVALGISGATQGGYVSIGPGQYRAALWSGSAASWVDLNPPGASYAVVNGVSGAQQVGEADVGDLRRASLWSGTAESWVDLNPAFASRSSAKGVSNGQQVGYVEVSNSRRASLWSGSAATWTSLHPAGASESDAIGVSGGQQVGFARVGGNAHASLWSGSAESRVDLNPAGIGESLAYGIADGEQVGQAGSHASLWRGSAESWVDLHPGGSEASVARGVSGGQQVGYAYVGDSPHASLWSGSASSWVDLHAFLPTGFSLSIAQGIWTEAGFTYVVGIGLNASTGRLEALLWSQPCGPHISLQPVTGQVPQGLTRTLSTAVTGAGPLSYQWRKDTVPLSNGGNISGAASPTLMIANAQPTDSAGYDCVVTSSCGTATSDIAYLTVIASCESIDYNGDGFVNPDDLGDFITSYFQAANLCQ